MTSMPNPDRLTREQSADGAIPPNSVGSAPSSFQKDDGVTVRGFDIPNPNLSASEAQSLAEPSSIKDSSIAEPGSGPADSKLSALDEEHLRTLSVSTQASLIAEQLPDRGANGADKSSPSVQFSKEHFVSLSFEKPLLIEGVSAIDEAAVDAVLGDPLTVELELRLPEGVYRSKDVNSIQDSLEALYAHILPEASPAQRADAVEGAVWVTGAVYPIANFEEIQLALKERFGECSSALVSVDRQGRFVDIEGGR